MNQPVFEKVPATVSLPAIEEKILALWDRIDAFAESNRRRPRADAGGKEFVFYDGPPFATGTPHYGHLLAGTIKDIIPRYWNMRGHHVERRFGWDCHGLPIENLAQKELGWNGAVEIREKGIPQFNEQCRSMVQTYVGEWRRTVRRMGRWVDFDNDYKTMDRPFMESVWWVFKQLWDARDANGQHRVYKAHRIMPYSWKLTTPLSNFEAGNNYKDVQDPAVTIRFKLLDFKDSEIAGGSSLEQSLQNPTVVEAIRNGRAYVLAWTTTPWTLPANLALCVGPKIIYSWIRDIATGDVYLLAKDRISAYYRSDEQYQVICEMVPHGGNGAPSPIALRYEPLFPHFSALQQNSQGGHFRIAYDDYVTTNDGTGVVHIAPAYGEDDYRIGKSFGLVHGVLSHTNAGNSIIDLVDPLDEECCFQEDFLVSSLVSINKPPVAVKVDEKKWYPHPVGKVFCKDADKAIIRWLKDEGKLVHQATITHSYPFCERTDTPLIYRAIEAWYVKVEDLRDQLLANNAQIRWVPEAVGANRFGNWLKEAKDWNISRNRFWGSCIPVWVNVSDRNDFHCVGSVIELEQLAGLPAGSVTDLHKHKIDQIEIRTKDKKTYDPHGPVYRRTPEVLDCWFESGAMPYASMSWMGGQDGVSPPPVFPAQFIAEGLDQTRGWFYTLLVLSTALFAKPAFKNVVVNGLVLAEDGQKMSKSKKNYPDPNLVLDQYGADALRAYLIDSPVVRAEPLKFSEAGLKEIVRTVVLPYWNALSFFTTYANVDGYDPTTWKARLPSDRRPMDRWVLSVLQSLVRDVNAEMEGYRLYNVVPRLVGFIDQLTNIYIRSNRVRFWRSSDRVDQSDAFATLHQVLTVFSKVLAPFMPFLTEEVHQRLVRPIDPQAPASVHWCDFPQVEADLIDPRLEHDVATILVAVRLGRKLREDHKLKVRQPLPAITVVSRDETVRSAIERFAYMLTAELNLKDVRTSADEAAFVAVSVKPNFKELRARCGAKLKDIGAVLTTWGHAEVARLEAGEAITVAGEPLTLGDLILERKPVGSTVTASDGNVTVVLDTTLTPALLAEGLAREFISVLQQARKDAGLEVTDRVIVQWDSTDPEVRAAVNEFTSVIDGEVLSTLKFTGQETMSIEPLNDGVGSNANLNGKPVRFTVTKA